MPFVLSDCKDLLPAEDLASLWFVLLLVFFLVSIFSRRWKYKRYNAELWVVLTTVCSFRADPLSSPFEQNLLRWNTEAVIPKSYKKNTTTYMGREGNNKYTLIITVL